MNKLLYDVGRCLIDPNFSKQNLKEMIVNNLPPTPLAVYDFVLSHPECSLYDVAQSLQMTPPHAANNLSDLVKLGLIKRKKLGVYRYRSVQ